MLWIEFDTDIVSNPTDHSTIRAAPMTEQSHAASIGTTAHRERDIAASVQRLDAKRF